MVAVSRRVFLTAIGAASLSLGVPASATAASRSADVRYGSFNIHHGADADGVTDLERIAVQIETMDCDVIGLQEVDRFWERSDFLDEPAWLAKRLGMHVAFGANLDLAPEGPDQPRREYGTALLSRWEITEHENTLLPVVDDHEQRGLLRTVIDAPDGALTFAVTHLAYEDEAERVAQAEKTLEILGSKPQRTVLVGDFNTGPGSESIRMVADTLPDSWAAAGSGDGFTYPADKPDARIDYVFASPDIVVTSIEVHSEDATASDHLPISGAFAVGC